MTPGNNIRWFYRTTDLEEAITACLRLILDDLRAHYRHTAAEAERLQNAGVAAAMISKRLQGCRKEVKGEYVPPNTDRGVQRTGV